MTKRLSFVKYEQELRPTLRERINSAESTEDVKKFFAHAVLELLEEVLLASYTQADGSVCHQTLQTSRHSSRQDRSKDVP